MGSCRPCPPKFPRTRTGSAGCAQGRPALYKATRRFPHLLSRHPKSCISGPRTGHGGATEDDETWAPPEARGGAREGPLPAHAGSKPRPHGRAPLSPPPAPNPIRGWHRLSNRLTNPAPPIAGRAGRGLGDQARLRGPSSKSLKVLQAKSSSALCRGSGVLRGVERRIVYFTTKSGSS